MSKHWIHWSLPILAVLGTASRPGVEPPAQVSVRLSEWKVELSQQAIAAGTVRFAITNAGSIPHAFEVEGHGIEKETRTIQPGASDTRIEDSKDGKRDKVKGRNEEKSDGKAGRGYAPPPA